MFERIILQDEKLPLFGSFPHAIRAGDFLFVTGQLSEDPETGEMLIDAIEEQVARVMENLKLVLAEAGTSLDKAVMARVFITDMRYFDTVNKIYSSYFQDGKMPCRTTIGVVGLAGMGDVEIDLIVYCKK
ncbi:RidA family protein [Spirulina sp. 06S082]|uniref:RidA family protein n=1 Tax=Spirulina sp. 06S082 TaxID=3110248 RepID=UPI002B1F6A00|nr:RidA family protein [Spirulina sp. 06S082]MEA5471060.1 RidA family protein [Spirulina sp. 06S082]